MTRNDTIKYHQNVKRKISICTVYKVDQKNVTVSVKVCMTRIDTIKYHQNVNSKLNLYSIRG